MRNSLELGAGFVATTDNSGGIGMKPEDVVQVGDERVGYFSARVTLLEQWAAEADPVAVILHNFSGSASWEGYCEGIRQAFSECNLGLPPISGSTESNMDMLQSAMAVTMIGRKSTAPTENDFAGFWYLYGHPLVGEAVIRESEKMADLGKVRAALEAGMISAIWPVGSGGVKAEWERLTGQPYSGLPANVDPDASAGPATAVFVRIVPDQEAPAKEHFGKYLYKLG